MFGPFILLGVILFALPIIFYFVPLGLWIQAIVSVGLGEITIVDLIRMRLRKIPPRLIVDSIINLNKAGLESISTGMMETHYLAGGHVPNVTISLIALACSALTSRSGFAAAGFFLAVYFPSFLVETGYGLVQDERILLFSVLHLLDMVGHGMFDAPQWVTVFGFTFEVELGWRTPFLLLAAIWTATASAVTMRLQRLEVTR